MALKIDTKCEGKLTCASKNGIQTRKQGIQQEHLKVSKLGL